MIFKRFAKSFVVILLVLNGTSCTRGSDNNEFQENPAGFESPSQRELHILLDAKRAILDLDLKKVESLSLQIDINQALPDGSTLLAWAVETQDFKLVNALLEKGALVREVKHQGVKNRFTPMIQACRYGNSAIINALLDKGADPNMAIEDGTSAFQLCAGSANVEDLKRMVSIGADASAENALGQTALMWAANYGKVENINYLVDIGASINKQTKEGYSPLFFAVKSHDLNAVKAVIDRGADLFATSGDGTTAAQLGVYTKNFEFLSWFVGALNSLMAQDAIDATLSAFDRDGYQLLHAAVKAEQPDLVKSLLDLGANPNAVSAPSMLKWRYEANFKTEDFVPPQLSAIELAEQNNLDTIASILRN